MKKSFLLLVLAMFAVLIVTAPALASNPPDVPKGAIYDINDDGLFNQADADLFNLCYGHKRGDNGWKCYSGAKPAGAPFYRTDMNFDGKVDFYDLMKLSRYVNWYQINGWWVE